MEEKHVSPPDSFPTFHATKGGAARRTWRGKRFQVAVTGRLVATVLDRGRGGPLSCRDNLISRD